MKLRRQNTSYLSKPRPPCQTPSRAVALSRSGGLEAADRGASPSELKRRSVAQDPLRELLKVTARRRWWRERRNRRIRAEIRHLY